MSPRTKLILQALVVVAALIFTVVAMYRPGGIVERVMDSGSSSGPTTNG